MVTKFEFGSLGEEYFRDWLLRNGYHLVPTSLIQTGGAPLLEGHIRQYVLPDFLAAKGGRCLWVDVKLKRRTTRNAKRQRWETGCALRQFEDYLSVQRTTGIPGALAFIHVEEKKLHLGTLDDLNVDRAEWLHDGRAGHAYGESMVFSTSIASTGTTSTRTGFTRNSVRHRRRPRLSGRGSRSNRRKRSLRRSRGAFGSPTCDTH